MENAKANARELTLHYMKQTKKGALHMPEPRGDDRPNDRPLLVSVFLAVYLNFLINETVLFIFLASKPVKDMILDISQLSPDIPNATILHL